MSLREAIDHIYKEQAVLADGLASESRDQSQLVRRANIQVRANDPLIYIGDRRSPPYIYIYIGGGRFARTRIVAVHRVLSNTGSRSKGLGPPRPRTNEDYVTLVEKLRVTTKKPESYRAKPLDRKYIPKGKVDTETIEPTLNLKMRIQILVRKHCVLYLSLLFLIDVYKQCTPLA